MVDPASSNLAVSAPALDICALDMLFPGTGARVAFPAKACHDLPWWRPPPFKRPLFEGVVIAPGFGNRRLNPPNHAARPAAPASRISIFGANDANFRGLTGFATNPCLRWKSWGRKLEKHDQGR